MSTLVDRVNEIIDAYSADRTNALAILQDIQREYNYLPRETLELTAQRLGITPGEIYRLATFFKAFSLQPKGEYMCRVCLGTACHVRGGPRILETLERELGIRAGQTTADGKFSLEAVRCLGACALGPIMVVNEEPHAYMSPDKAISLIAQLATGEVEGRGRETSPSGEAPAGAVGRPAQVAEAARAPVDLSSVPPAG